MQPLSREQIDKDYLEQLTTQSYSAVDLIHGVEIRDLKLLVDDGGAFAELIRLDDNGNLEVFPDFKVRQSSYSEILPGAIKAFHMHLLQDDVWFTAPTDRLLVGLLDTRESSPTFNKSMRFVLGGGKAQLLRIPRGVAHGAGNLWVASATLIYFVSQQFNREESDEHRLPHDILGPDFWKIIPG